MTREEEIKKVAGTYAIKKVAGTYAKDTCNPASKRGLLYNGFVDGAQWADQHPHWISVEDELPPVGQWIITYEPTSPIVVGTDIILPDETADEHHITHWIPLPQAPKGGEI